jgi:hypothetical protein
LAATQIWLNTLSKKNQNKLYTMPVDYIFDLIMETENNVKGATELISHFIEEISVEENKYVFCLACEIVSSGSGVLRLLEKEIETAVLADDTEEIVMLQTTLEILQNLVVSNYYASRELSRTFYSANLH